MDNIRGDGGFRRRERVIDAQGTEEGLGKVGVIGDAIEEDGESVGVRGGAAFFHLGWTSVVVAVVGVGVG